LCAASAHQHISTCAEKASTAAHVREQHQHISTSALVLKKASTAAHVRVQHQHISTCAKRQALLHMFVCSISTFAHQH